MTRAWLLSHLRIAAGTFAMMAFVLACFAIIGDVPR